MQQIPKHDMQTHLVISIRHKNVQIKETIKAIRRGAQSQEGEEAVERQFNKIDARESNIGSL